MVPTGTGSFHDLRYWQDLGQTFRFAVASVTLELLLGLAIALLLNQPQRGRALIRTTSLIPWALPTTVMALGWRWIFNTPYGPVNRLFESAFGQSLNALGEPSLAWLTTVYADVWKTTPFVALILLAGLQTIPSDLYEAARLEGAGLDLLEKDHASLAASLSRTGVDVSFRAGLRSV